jgi:ribosomal protein L36
MKVRASVKRNKKGSEGKKSVFFVRRKGKLYKINKQDRRENTRQG